MYLISDSTMCGDPEQPVFSIVNRTSQSTVQYSCVKGHRMEGGTGSVRHCSDKGVWMGSPPKCVGKFYFGYLETVLVNLAYCYD